jgi:hypothetical protein
MHNDAPALRFHRPKHALMTVNATPYKVYPRQAGNALGANGRDSVFNVSNYAYEGTNRVALRCVDPRPFVMTVFLARPRADADARAMMLPKQTLEQERQRVSRIVRGA